MKISSINSTHTHTHTQTHTHTPSHVFGDLLVNNEGAAHGLCYSSALRYQNAWFTNQEPEGVVLVRSRVEMCGSSATGGMLESLTRVYGFQYCRWTLPVLWIYSFKKKNLFRNNGRLTHSCRKSYRESPHSLHSVSLTGIIFLNSGATWPPGHRHWRWHGGRGSHPSRVRSRVCARVHWMPLSHTRT